MVSGPRERGRGDIAAVGLRSGMEAAGGRREEERLSGVGSWLPQGCSRP